MLPGIRAVDILFMVLTRACAFSSCAKTLQESDGEHSACSAERRKLDVQDADVHEGKSDPSNEDVCDSAEVKVEAETGRPGQHVVNAVPSEDEVRVALASAS